jgi:hypothetical protein
MRIILGMIWRVILTFKVERRGEGDADDKELSAAQSTLGPSCFSLDPFRALLLLGLALPRACS